MTTLLFGFDEIEGYLRNIEKECTSALPYSVVLFENIASIRSALKGMEEDYENPDIEDLVE